MQIIHKDRVIYAMSRKNAPVATARSGESLTFEVIDALGGALTSEEQTLGSLDWSHVNPATGPLFVEEAKPGDILKVTIRDIRLEDQGVMIAIPGSGAVGDRIAKERTKIVRLRDGKALFNDRIQLDVKPMIGVIGTAPAGEAIPTGTPGKHGGNMDCTTISPGALLYLPVAVPGALLALGDLHAAMGDGEIVICGVEIGGAVDVRVDVLKDVSWPLPMVVQKRRVATIASAPTLDEAAHVATNNMLDFVTAELKISAEEAGMLLSAAADLRICQIVDPLKTARMELPLDILRSYGYEMK